MEHIIVTGASSGFGAGKGSININTTPAGVAALVAGVFTSIGKGVKKAFCRG